LLNLLKYFDFQLFVALSVKVVEKKGFLTLRFELNRCIKYGVKFHLYSVLQAVVFPFTQNRIHYSFPLLSVIYNLACCKVTVATGKEYNFLGTEDLRLKLTSECESLTMITQYCLHLSTEYYKWHIQFEIVMPLLEEGFNSGKRQSS